MLVSGSSSCSLFGSLVAEDFLLGCFAVSKGRRRQDIFLQFIILPLQYEIKLVNLMSRILSKCCLRTLCGAVGLV